MCVKKLFKNSSMMLRKGIYLLKSGLDLFYKGLKIILH